MASEVLRLQPDRHQILSVAGQIHEQLGDIQLSESCHEKAVAVKPDFAEGYFQLSSLHSFTSDDPVLREMERIGSLESLDRTVRFNIEYAIANAYHQLGRYETAFEHYTIANKLMAEDTDYTISAIQAQLDGIRKTFTSGFFDQLQTKGSSDRTPIFILGMPRSGTTLCEQILSSHEDVYGGGELAGISSFATSSFAKISLGKYPEWLPYITDQQLAQFADGFIAELRKMSPDTTHVTDKTPGNFIYIGLIRLAFPNAKIIHCHRDPMDNCLSLFRTAFAGQHYYSCDLEDLARYYRCYVEVMDHWHRLLPGEIHDWRYESVIKDVEGETRKLLDFLDLAWDQNCLDFHRSTRAVNTASVVQVRQPLYASSLGGWRNYEKELEPVREILLSMS